MITAPIEVIGTDADDVKWVSLQDVKDELGITDASQDAILTKRIERASSRLLKVSNLRGVAFRRYEETLPGYGMTTQLMVTRTPIVNMLTVEIVNTGILIDGGDGTDITGEVLLQDPKMGVLFRKFGWRWSALRGAPLGFQMTELGDPLPGTEEPIFRVDFEAGWVMPDQTVPAPTGPNTPEPFPEDLQEAALKQVVWDHRRAGRAGDVKSKKVGDTTIQYATIMEEGRGGAALAAIRMFGLNPEAFALLDPYRRAA